MSKPLTRLLLLTVLAPSAGLHSVQPILRATRASDSRMTAPLTQERGGAPTVPLSSSVINLSKNIICGGFLSLPAGIAACAQFPTAATLLPAGGLLAFMGLLSAYCFSLIGRACALTREPSYAGAWTRSIGMRSGPLIKASLTLKTGATCLSYSMILADMAAQLTGVPRPTALAGVTATVLLPLCLLDTSKTFGLLRYSSAAGLAATAFVTCFMGLRYFTGGYATAPVAGPFLAGVPLSFHPHFGGSALGTTALPLFGGLTSGLFVLLSILATAFMAHYNAPAFLRDAAGLRLVREPVNSDRGGDHSAGSQMEERLTTPTDAGIARFNKVVALSFASSAATFFAVAAFGFLTFGAGAAGNVLSNYARSDPLALGARFALGISLVAGYPLAFAGLQKAAYEAIGRVVGPGVSPKAVSLLLLGLITSAATVLTDLGFVSAFAGALLGSAIIYVYPSIMFRGAVRCAMVNTSMDSKRQARLKFESAASVAITLAGIALMALGGGTTIQARLARGGA